MKTFIISVFLMLSLGTSSFANSVEDLEVTLFSGATINPISVVEKEVYYPSASEDEDSVVTIFVSTFKGWPSKVVDEEDDNVGIFY